jgi:hypothetical protein
LLGIAAIHGVDDGFRPVARLLVAAVAETLKEKESPAHVSGGA